MVIQPIYDYTRNNWLLKTGIFLTLNKIRAKKNTKMAVQSLSLFSSDRRPTSGIDLKKNAFIAHACYMNFILYLYSLLIFIL